MAKVTPSPMLLNHYHLLDKLRRWNALYDLSTILCNWTRFKLRDWERTSAWGPFE